MALKKTIVEPSWEAKYSFSPAVITEGGKTIWLAGHVGFVDDGGASLAGNFDAQTRQAFKNLEKTLQRAGGSIGMANAARSPGDGYTILLASSSIVVNPSLYNKVPYDVDKDFIPVTKAGRS